MRPVLLVVFLLTLASSQHLADLTHLTFSDSTGIPLQFSKNFTLDHNWFIMFYAPWCHHCKTTFPEWVKLASTYTNNTKIGVVNCDANFQICDALSVHGYPTLIFFAKNGTAYDYRSQRRYEGFVKFLNGEYVEHPQRTLKKMSISEYFFDFVAAMDVFSLLICATLCATFWFVIFRFLFSERVQEISPKTNKTD